MIEEIITWDYIVVINPAMALEKVLTIMELGRGGLSMTYGCSNVEEDEPEIG